MRVSPIRTSLLLLILALALLASACSAVVADDWENLPPGAYAPHPVFENYYLSNGGYDQFGYAISTSYTNQFGERYQYFETVLMKFDPASEQISFEPLGLALGVDKLPTLPWVGDHPDDGLIVGEFNIHPAFVPMFLSLGPDLTGLPVTQPFVNAGRNRVEQHFENLGMFYQLDDSDQSAALLDYGLVHCTSCGTPDLNNVIIQTPLSESFFYSQMKQDSISMGVTGEVLKGPSQTLNGATELVFEHMALRAVNGEMHILPLAVMLGLDDEFLYAPLGHPAMIFFEISNGTGHNILRPFDTYIQQNGGYMVSGAPISEIIVLNSELGQIRQCFQNYCLDYLPQIENSPVRPVRLGDQYLDSGLPSYTDKIIPDEVRNTSQGVRHTNPFTLIVWEHPTVVDSQTPETISVMVALENTPQPGQRVILTVNYPDGTSTQIEMPPTQDNGTTTYTLDPVVAENGDLVLYEACLVVEGTSQLCVQQSFMIWGNP
jgi:hypothetical protein